jgi:hypothetical protein
VNCQGKHPANDKRCKIRKKIRARTLSKLRDKEAERATREILLAQQPYETVCLKNRENRNLKHTCATIRKSYAQITATEGNQANVSNLLVEKVDKLGTILQQ